MELEVESLKIFEEELKSGADVRLVIAENPIGEYMNIGFLLTAKNGDHILRYSEEMGPIRNDAEGTKEIQARIGAMSTGIVAKGANFKTGGAWKG